MKKNELLAMCVLPSRVIVDQVLNLISRLTPTNLKQKITLFVRPYLNLIVVSRAIYDRKNGQCTYGHCKEKNAQLPVAGTLLYIVQEILSPLRERKFTGGVFTYLQKKPWCKVEELSLALVLTDISH